ncbi:MAG: LPS assembly protein LptD [Thiotrichaceae bacterium]|nr:LPS assembly protein LptD [Thiotrichaceae bacterium]
MGIHRIPRLYRQQLLASLVGLIFFFSITVNNYAADIQWASCSTSRNPVDIQRIADMPEGATVVEADNAILKKKGVSKLEGHAVIQNQDRTINGQDLNFDNRNSTVTAFGKVLLSTQDIDIKAKDINYKIDKDEGTLKGAVYILKNGSGNGSGGTLVRKGKNLSTLANATFSTCPIYARSWYIQAKRIDLLHDKKIGVARHLTLKIGGIPIFYTPYADFPLNGQRKSGLLMPSYQITDRSGSIFSIPYYFNIAPNIDATVHAKVLTKRGSMLETELRYLTATHQGELNVNYLPSDDNAGDINRHLVSINHRSKLHNNTQLSIKATKVSDDHYFSDLANSLSTTSTAYLERRLDLTKSANHWKFSGSIQNYKILDGNSIPYSRLPELKLSYRPQLRNRRNHFNFESELVKFDKDNATTGLRFDLNTNLSHRFGTSGWYVKPSVQLRYTQYALEDSTSNNHLTRSLATSSLDTGLFFERNIHDNKIMQTLEPRLHYTYTPFKDQSNFPVFDTAKFSTSSHNQLFSTNRFSGKDRIGDTEKLTLGFTSRLINNQRGQELFKMSLGQAFYFSDRLVTLPNNAINTVARTEFALELTGKVTENTRLINNTYWDPEDGKVNSSETRLHYADKKQRRVNLSYRSLSDELEQAELSFSFPINKKWKILGRTDYDINNHRVLETLTGVEYSNCCVKTRFVTRRFLTADNETYDTTPFIEFELKGMGSIGSQGRNLLEEKIYGYKND